MRVHPGGKGLEMCEDAPDGPVAPGTAPRGCQRLLEVLLKRARQARGPGHPLLRSLLRHQIVQEQGQIPTLHLLRGRTGRHRMLEILVDPPSKTILAYCTQEDQGSGIVSCSVLGHAAPPFAQVK